jgi:hypothetical protein
MTPKPSDTQKLIDVASETVSLRETIVFNMSNDIRLMRVRLNHAKEQLASGENYLAHLKDLMRIAQQDKSDNHVCIKGEE